MFQLTQFLHNAVFFRNQNARYAGNRCTYYKWQSRVNTYVKFNLEVLVISNGQLKKIDCTHLSTVLATLTQAQQWCPVVLAHNHFPYLARIRYYTITNRQILRSFEKIYQSEKAGSPWPLKKVYFLGYFWWDRRIISTIEPKYNDWLLSIYEFRMLNCFYKYLTYKIQKSNDIQLLDFGLNEEINVPHKT